MLKTIADVSPQLVAFIYAMAGMPRHPSSDGAAHKIGMSSVG